MLKKILFYFVLLVCFFLYIFKIVFAETLQQKLERIKAGSLQTVDNQDITLELKLEDINRKDVYIPIKVIWRNEDWFWYGLKYFWMKSSLESLSKTIPQNETHWYLEITNWNTNWEWWIARDFKIDLDYNKFNWTLREKRLLYYIQFKFNSDIKKYEFVKYYTQNELENEQKIENEITDLSIKWEIKNNYFPLMSVDIWLYDSEGQKIVSTLSDINWKYELKIFNYKDKIQLWKTYYLIWQKSWNIKDWTIWILSEGRQYKFKNNREILATFNWVINITAKINDKDIVRSENFPWEFLIILIGLYIWFIYYLFVKIVKKIFLHSLNWKTQTLVYEQREKKINDIKSKLKKIWKI